ncbi:hypothetical protein B6I80_02410 [Klebsiella pneumoniae]|nr:hypothetical protein B6I80_02410 [Klebsiella pneumoniae]HBX4175070.1 hypothetical protein [Klebsiella pneumoniae]
MRSFYVCTEHGIRDFINKNTEITEKVLEFRFKLSTIAVVFKTLMRADNNRMLKVIFQRTDKIFYCVQFNVYVIASYIPVL